MMKESGAFSPQSLFVMMSPFLIEATLGRMHRFRETEQRKIDNQITVEKSPPMRAAILVLSFLPFLYYGTKDNLFHFRGRKVSRIEHILHAAIGLVLAIMFSHALMAHHLIVLSALLLFVVAGGVDEYVFHRDIPGEESDLHAKEHLALLIFIVVSLATDWLERNNWNLTQALMQLHRASGGTP